MTGSSPLKCRHRHLNYFISLACSYSISKLKYQFYDVGNRNFSCNGNINIANKKLKYCASWKTENTMQFLTCGNTLQQTRQKKIILCHQFPETRNNKTIKKIANPLFWDFTPCFQGAVAALVTKKCQLEFLHRKQNGFHTEKKVDLSSKTSFAQRTLEE